MKRLVRHSPTVITYSIEGNMKPKLAWLRERIGLDADGIQRLVGRIPRIFALKVCCSSRCFVLRCVADVVVFTATVVVCAPAKLALFLFKKYTRRREAHNWSWRFPSVQLYCRGRVVFFLGLGYWLR